VKNEDLQNPYDSDIFDYVLLWQHFGYYRFSEPVVFITNTRIKIVYYALI